MLTRHRIGELEVTAVPAAESLGRDGAAIGVVCTSASTTEDHRGMGGGPNPELAAQLPGWLLRALGYTSVALRLAADVSRTAKRSR